MNMNRKPTVRIAMALLAQLAFVAIAQGAEPKDADAGGAVGAMAVEAATTTATVLAIDPAGRMITLRRADGTDATFRAGPEVRNFDQIKVGDQVKATTMKSVAVYTRKAGEAPGAAAQQTIAVAPKGAMPGAMITKTVDVTAKVLAIDSRKRLVELQAADGKERTVHVGPNVDLSAVREGDEVVMRSTERLAISVERLGSAGERNAPPALRNTIVAEGVTTSATIASLDKGLRTITLKRPDGSEQTFRAGNGVINFDQLQAGDEVKATLIEEMAISIRKPDAPVPAAERESVALAPGGALDTAAVAKVEQVTLKVKAVNAEERDITFQDAGGQARIVQVGPGVSLEGLKAGDEVVVRMTPGVVVAVDKMK